MKIATQSLDLMHSCIYMDEYGFHYLCADGVQEIVTLPYPYPEKLHLTVYDSPGEDRVPVSLLDSFQIKIEGVWVDTFAKFDESVEEWTKKATMLMQQDKGEWLPTVWIKVEYQQ